MAEDLLKQFNKIERKVFKKFPKKVLSASSSSARKGMQLVQASAKAKLRSQTTKRTGLLEEAVILKAKTFKNKDEVKASVHINTKLRGTFNGQRVVPHKYVYLIEYGTKNFSAKPFLRPALENNQANVFGVYKAEMKKKIKSLAKRLSKGKL